MNRLYLYILPITVLLSCSKDNKAKELKSNEVDKAKVVQAKVVPESIPFSEYEKFVYSMDETIEKRKINDFQFRARLVSPEEKVMKELENERITEQVFDSLMNDFGGLVYVDLSIDRDDFNEELLKYDIQNVEEYQKRISYYAFDFQSEIKMEVCGQKYACKLYHFERNFGMKSELNFSLGFDVPKTDCNDQLIKLIVDDKIYNTGRIKFNFSYQPFPEIKFNS